MLIIKVLAKAGFLGFLLITSNTANATAFSFADVFIDFDSISITSDQGISVGAAQLDSFVSIDDESGQQDNFDFGDQYLLNEITGVNADATTDGLQTLTNANSIFGDTNGASALSELSIFIPFTTYSGIGFDISFDYQLFASADTDNAGEFSIATAGIEYAVFDSDDNLIGDVFTDDVFAQGVDGTSDVASIDSFFGFDYFGLSKGDYYLSIDLFSDSFTEANIVATSVPAPGTLFLLALGLLATAKFKHLNSFRKTSPLAISA